jgi:hypothetical protein
LRSIRGFLPANSSATNLFKVFIIFRLVRLVRVIKEVILMLMVVTAATVCLFPAAYGLVIFEVVIPQPFQQRDCIQQVVIGRFIIYPVFFFT